MPLDVENKQSVSNVLIVFPTIMKYLLRKYNNKESVSPGPYFD